MMGNEMVAYLLMKNGMCKYTYFFIRSVFADGIKSICKTNDKKKVIWHSYIFKLVFFIYFSY